MYKQTIELQIDMNKEIKKLLNFLKSEYLGLWAMPLLLVVLYETGALTEGTYAGDARMEYILQSVCILLTVCLIPLSLRLFSLNLVKRIKELPLQEALKSYRLWSEVRLALLEADVGYKVVKDFIATADGTGHSRHILLLSHAQHFGAVLCLHGAHRLALLCAEPQAPVG